MTMIVTAPAEKGTKITLHWSEVAMAAHQGALRKAIGMREEGRGGSVSDTPDKWWREIEGNCSELAFAKAVDRYWTGAAVGADKEERTRLKRFDVGRYQVRTCDLPYGSLIVQPSDNPDDIFVLVIGESPLYRVVGWMWGKEARQDKYWRSDIKKPAWLVPQCDLHDLDSLPSCEEVEEELEL